MNAAPPPTPVAQSAALPDPLVIVRGAVRDLLLASPAYRALEPPARRAVAQTLVKICAGAATLLKEEAEVDSELAARAGNWPHSAPPVAMAQSAGSEFSGVSASRVASTTRDILNAVSFPRFVTELINGVFKAIVDSSHQQMQSFVELLNNVSASLDGFADANVGANGARQWLADKYPGSYQLSGDSENDGFSDDASAPPEKKLQLRDGASPPSENALRVDLGLAPEESVPTGDPEQTLVPFARRQMARQRQQLLATMVMLGMQRIVIESGRITAAMRFHIDTRSAAQDDRASRFDFQNQIKAAGSFGVGPWGFSASMTNTIGYVSTQKTQTTEEMNTDLDLNSSVELVFKTDYLPLDRMAGQGTTDRIRVNTLNPEAETKAATDSRTARERAAAESDTARRTSLNAQLGPTGIPAADAAPNLPAQTSPATKTRPANQPAAGGPTQKPNTPSAPAASGSAHAASPAAGGQV